MGDLVAIGLLLFGLLARATFPTERDLFVEIVGCVLYLQRGVVVASCSEI